MLATLVLDVPIMLSGLLILAIDCVTEQAPAISLAYEPPEASVMARPPRNPKSDRLVDFPLLMHSYVVIGVAETAACVLAFCAVFFARGVPLGLAVYHPRNWAPDGSSPPLPLDDGSGRVLDGEEQAALYTSGVAAYFITLVACQAWHIFMAKTRRASLATHSVLLNATTLYGVAFSLAFVVFIVYTPTVNAIFSASSAPGVAWAPNIAFAIAALAYTEAVKARARRDAARGAAASCVTRSLAW